MSPLLWLVVALVAGVAGYLVAWPAWQSYRARVTPAISMPSATWRGEVVRCAARRLGFARG